MQGRLAVSVYHQVMVTAVVQGVKILVDNVPGKEKRVKSACIIPGILLAGILLSSVNVLPDSWMALLPPGVARALLMLISFYGGISILKDMTLYFMKVFNK